MLLHKSSAGIVKITGLSAPNIKGENEYRSILTNILRLLSREVWPEPKREADTTFNVASHRDDQKRAADLPNYNIKSELANAV